MIKAKHHSILYPFFKRLCCLLLRRNFRAMHLKSNYIDNGTAILVVANHVSWWDGFWIEYINQKRLKRTFHFMMLEKQLRKHWYFQYVGGYSINRNSRDVLKTIAYTNELLTNPQNVVLMFPQGKIHSAYNANIHFERGIQHIVDNAADNTQVLFVANFSEYLKDSKPHVYSYTKMFLTQDFKTMEVEEAYNLFYRNSINQHKNLSC